MKWKTLFPLMGMILAGALGSPLRAQVPSPQAVPAVQNPASSSSDGETDDPPFRPYWENEFQLGYSRQQAGQNTNSLTYTGTQHLDEAGDFFSGEAEVSRQKVEGVVSSTGTLTAAAGMGLGFFTPSLALGFQGGESALRQINGDLAMGFQLWDPLALDLTLGGNVGSHQGDVTSLLPQLSVLGKPVTARIDTASWNASLGPSFTPWDGCSISATAGYEYDVTYQVQSITDPAKKKSINQADQIGTLTLDLSFTLFKGFTLDLIPQVGKEYSPAGTFYSSLSGGLVSFSSPTVQDFVSGTVTAGYSFE